ncbi:TatD family hydrolase [Guyparkeria sp. 1SP6A2]|nr:TatD family hydrolase [Guyparkeria sp. 1SP6A2]
MPTRTTNDRLARRWTGPLLGLALALTVALADPAGAETPLFDAHLHYQADQRAAIPPGEIIAILKDHGIEHAVVTSTPPANAQVLAEVAPERIIPFLGVYRDRADKEDWMHDDSLPDRVERWLAAGDWRGIGELHIFGRDRDSPVLRRLVEIAAQRDLVLMIHGDLAIIDRIFEIEPGSTLLWAHLGDRPEPTILRAALARHPEGLFIDTSVRDERFVDENGVLLPEWRALFIAHPRRFVVGVDTYSLPRWRRFGAAADTIRLWLDQLPESVARRIARENARELLLDPLLLGLPDDRNGAR